MFFPEIVGDLVADRHPVPGRQPVGVAHLHHARPHRRVLGERMRRGVVSVPDAAAGGADRDPCLVAQALRIIDQDLALGRPVSPQHQLAASDGDRREGARGRELHPVEPLREPHHAASLGAGLVDRLLDRPGRVGLPVALRGVDLAHHRALAVRRSHLPAVVPGVGKIVHKSSFFVRFPALVEGLPSLRIEGAPPGPWIIRRFHIATGARGPALPGPAGPALPPAGLAPAPAAAACACRACPPLAALARPGGACSACSACSAAAHAAAAARLPASAGCGASAGAALRHASVATPGGPAGSTGCSGATGLAGGGIRGASAGACFAGSCGFLPGAPRGQHPEHEPRKRPFHEGDPVMSGVASGGRFTGGNGSE